MISEKTMLIVERQGVMENFTVSLFGHREIDDLRGLERKLSRRIEELLRRHEYVTIFIGRNGEFDEYYRE